jgi:hypothetical protein
MGSCKIVGAGRNISKTWTTFAVERCNTASGAEAGLGHYLSKRRVKLIAKPIGTPINRPTSP